jgi:hypothetical protein
MVDAYSCACSNAVASATHQVHFMKIAVTSQNRKTITEHAGKCRKFWIYNIQNQQVIGKVCLNCPWSKVFTKVPRPPALRRRTHWTALLC